MELFNCQMLSMVQHLVLVVSLFVHLRVLHIQQIRCNVLCYFHIMTYQNRFLPLFRREVNSLLTHQYHRLFQNILQNVYRWWEIILVYYQWVFQTQWMQSLICLICHFLLFSLQVYRINQNRPFKIGFYRYKIK